MTTILDQLRPYRHRVYGLTVATWISFPELVEVSVAAPADAVFRLGEVPKELESPQLKGARFQAGPSCLLTWTPGVARYLVKGGNEIVVQPEPKASESDVRGLLLCSPLGALLHQRGLLPLHASVIITERGAVAFMGRTGSGKSTLAAHLLQRGFRVLADDLAVVSFAADGQPWAAPGMPQFKLWPDSIAQLGAEAGPLPRVRPEMEKRALAFGGGFHRQPVPIVRLYALEAEPGAVAIGLDSLPAIDQMRLLLDHTYRPRYLAGLGLQAEHFRNVAQFAKAVPVLRLVRPDDGRFRLTELADVLAADFVR